MTKIFPLATLFLFGCANLSEGEDTDGDSMPLADTDETNSAAEVDESEATDSGTGDESVCPHPAEYVCLPANTELDVDSFCSAVVYCFRGCSESFCEDEIGNGDCEPIYEEFYAQTPSETCVDRWTAFGDCHLGLTCAERLVSACDPTHACFQAALDFHEAGCESALVPSCG